MGNYKSELKHFCRQYPLAFAWMLDPESKDEYTVVDQFCLSYVFLVRQYIQQQFSLDFFLFVRQYK